MKQLFEKIKEALVSVLPVTLIVIVLNYHYFSNGYKKLFILNPNMDSLIALGSFSSIVYGIIAIIMIINNIFRRRCCV